MIKDSVYMGETNAPGEIPGFRQASRALQLLLANSVPKQHHDLTQQDSRSDELESYKLLFNT